MTDRPTLAFAEEHIPAIRDGEKDLTFRLHGSYDESGITQACELDGSIALVDPDDEPFAIATVRSRISTRVVELAAGTWQGHEPLHTVRDVVEMLCEYYPDQRPFAAKTGVDVIRFDVVETVEYDSAE